MWLTLNITNWYDTICQIPIELKKWVLQYTVWGMREWCVILIFDSRI